MTTTGESSTGNPEIDLSAIRVDNPELAFSLYAPLGENALIQLNDQLERRKDSQILETDLYYQLKIQYQEFAVKFYSRGLIKISFSPEVDQLSLLIQKASELKPKIPAILRDLLSGFHLALLGPIPLEKTIHISIVHEGFHGVPPCGSETERKLMLKKLATHPTILKFLRTSRSVDCRPHEDIIIGTHGSIIRSDQIGILLSYHAYVRALHLFLRRYNILLEESVWKKLKSSDELVDNFDDYLRKQQESKDIGRRALFSDERRKKLAKTRSHVIHSIKDVDNYIALARFIDDSIDFTTERFMEVFDAEKVKENSFDIRKVLSILSDRAEHLKIVAESFAAQGRTLLSRLELYSSEVAAEALDSVQDKMAFLDDGTRRARPHELDRSGHVVDVKTVVLENPRILYSLFIPLGENGIIRLFGRLRMMDDVTITETDLYYYIQARYQGCTISFYSRGLVYIEVPSEGNFLEQILKQAEKQLPTIPPLLRPLLTKYSLSLLEVLNEIEAIPIHKVIVGTRIKIPVKDGSYSRLSDEERDDWLLAAAQHPEVSSFIGDARSIDSIGNYEDVIIGTRGSIIRSEEIDILLSYHAYNRSLHLFIEEYNLIAERTWNMLELCDELVVDFQAYVRREEEKSSSLKIGLFPSDIRKRLGKVRSQALSGIKDIDNFLVLTNFLEDSIDFTIERYVEEIEAGRVKPNSFHIRKVLRTLHDRAKHLKIVSETFVIRGRSLLDRIDLYDSEIAYETQQRLEKIAFVTALLGIVLALIAIWIEF
ncbi:MAG: hypothetical protein ACE5OZ_23575 [Candidatus Heimdallarchaeota archaeon]